MMSGTLAGPLYSTFVYKAYIYIKQSNESEISPIKPASVNRIQAWIRRVFRKNDYVQVKSSKR